MRLDLFTLLGVGGKQENRFCVWPVHLHKTALKNSSLVVKNQAPSAKELLLRVATEAEMQASSSCALQVPSTSIPVFPTLREVGMKIFSSLCWLPIHPKLLTKSHTTPFVMR